ncbi:PREDICTED: ubiquitin carboxyl-terminal hydrolase 37-like isoform X1 [Poecilia mexicana]|uniref:ubiquitin carboxyl-terminal hydrolase 37-like isoform X1 n=1 Tax=Poecilia mexicana TaxID=48701 RepID=UPI00072DC537|nr:PREDICTED: ubiquitin carboxyl-terminal hydrolase 37-like isoform X1 [Poecilia mexicana]
MFHHRNKKKHIICEKADGDQDSHNNNNNNNNNNNWINYWLQRLYNVLKYIGFPTSGTTQTRYSSQEKKQQKKTRKKKNFWGLFDCFMGIIQVHPDTDNDSQDQKRSPLLKETKTQQYRSYKEEDISSKHNVPTKFTTIQVQSTCMEHQNATLLGFPNVNMICYMNASLQTLLTLKEFVEDIKSQEDVLALCPEAQLMRCFLDIVKCHGSPDSRLKLEVVIRFKKVLSFQAPEFGYEGMKDAHEFLTAVLDQMKNLLPPLTKMAATIGKRYRCPVQTHLEFKMRNTRMCKGCGVKSIREESFIMLSLDLIAGGSVQNMLNVHQKERQLEFKCECGGNTSVLQSRFLTLPKYLILQLKRFTFTENLVMVKLEDPIILCREMTVAGHQYSLVSVISHVGSSAKTGHYVSDGLHPEQSLEDGNDRWLHFNDIYVMETNGTVVSEMCTEESYILVYQRREWPSLL